LRIVRSATIAAALLALGSAAFADRKAYDLVKYRAKAAGGLTIALDFADGYPQASEIRITEARGKLTTRFVLENNADVETMRFVPEKDRDDGRAVVLKMSADAAAPETIEGTYHIEQNTIPFTLKRR
jgi:hypothetical protein